jgi:hypothetical protein
MLSHIRKGLIRKPRAPETKVAVRELEWVQRVVAPVDDDVEG